tara:strand:- start:101 stop:505 length:405 start_codon:yes stop_codon:yes gene_type:complete
MAVFPSYIPTRRNFTPGVFPQKTFRTLGGVAAKRTFGNVAYGAKLELEFTNITDDKVQAIIAHYQYQTQRNQRFQLPDTVVAGMNASLATSVKAVSTLRWEYESPPAIESIFRGISVVSLTLIGEIRDPKTDDA